MRKKEFPFSIGIVAINPVLNDPVFSERDLLKTLWKKKKSVYSILPKKTVIVAKI